MRRATSVCGVLVLAVCGLCVAQEPAWKARFLRFAAGCGIDPNSRSRSFRSSPAADASAWVEVCSSDPMQEQEQDTSDDAEVWTGSRRTRLVSMVRSSQSGDWSFANYYCFRPNGSLSRVASTYATSNAETAFDYVRWLEFDETGHVKKNSTQFYRLGTSDVIAQPAELKSIHEFAESVPVYKNVSKLPLADPLKNPSRCGAK